MSTTPITSKKQMFSELSRGLLGNHLPIWDNAFSMLFSVVIEGFSGDIGVRSRSKVGESFASHVKPLEAIEIVKAKGIKDPIFCECPPDDHLLIQGEVSLGEGAHLTRNNAPLREAMEMGCHWYGWLETLIILRDSLDGTSYDEFEFLVDQYPGHILEFSAYSVPVGVLRGRNWIVWEVRSY